MQLLKLPEDVRHAILEHFSHVLEKRSKAALIVLKYVDTEYREHSGSGIPKSVETVIHALVSRLTKNNKEGIYTTLQTLLNLHGSLIRVAHKLIKQYFMDGKQKAEEDTEDGSPADKLVSEILGYNALIRSGHLGQHPEIFKQTVSRLLGIIQDDTNTDVIATISLKDLLERYPDASRADEVWKQLEKVVNVPIQDMSPCTLCVRLVLMKKCTDLPSWLTSTLIKENYKALNTVLMKCTASLPKVHPVIEEFVASLARLGTDKNFPLGSFWLSCCFPNLHSSDKKAQQLTLVFLQLVLGYLTRKSEVISILNRQLIAFLMRTARTDKVLRAAIPGLTSALEKLVQVETEDAEELRLAVTQALIVHPGSIQFDAITQTKMLSSVVKLLSVYNLKSLGKCCGDMLKDNDTLIAEQVGAAEALSNLLAHPRLLDESAWRLQQLQTLLVAALIPRKTRAVQNAFCRTLYREAQKAPDVFEFLKHVVEFGNMEIQNIPSDKLIFKLDGKEQWDKVMNSLEILETEKEEWPEKCQYVLKMLHYAMIIYIIQDPNGATEFMPKLDDLFTATRKENLSSVLVDSSFWLTKTMKILVSFRPDDNTLFRIVAGAAFRHLVDDQIPETICELIDIIEPAQDGEPQEDEDEDDALEDEDLEEIEDEEKDDLMHDDEEEEEDDTENTEGMDEEEEEMDEGGDDIDMDDEEGDSDDENHAELKAKLQKELMGEDGTIEDIDLDEAPEEELENLDKKLGSIFAAYKAKTKPQSKNPSKRERVGKQHLLFRAYDFLEIYIESRVSMGLILGIIRPLMDSLAYLEKKETVGYKGVEAKIMRLRKLLELIASVKSFKNVDMSVQEISEELDSFVNYTIDYPRNLAQHVTDCHKLILMCSIKVLGKMAHNVKKNPIIKSYSEFIILMLDKKEPARKIQTYSEACKLDWGALWKIVGDMVVYAFEKKASFYSKANALTVLCILYENKSLLKRIHESEFKEMGTRVSRGILRILHMFNDQLQVRYLSNLGEFLAVLRRYHSDPTASGINWEEIQMAVTKLDSKLDPELTTLRAAIKDYLSILKKTPLTLDTTNTRKDEETGKDTKKRELISDSRKKKKIKVDADNEDNTDGDDDTQGKKKKTKKKRTQPEPTKKNRLKQKTKRKKQSKRAKRDD